VAFALLVTENTSPRTRRTKVHAVVLGLPPIICPIGSTTLVRKPRLLTVLWNLVFETFIAVSGVETRDLGKKTWCLICSKVCTIPEYCESVRGKQYAADTDIADTRPPN
jgi:hypothetical protein